MCVNAHTEPGVATQDGSNDALHPGCKRALAAPGQQKQQTAFTIPALLDKPRKG